MTEFNHELSRASTAQITELLRREDLFECELTAFPHIGEANADKLSDAGFNKISQLVGKLLSYDNGVRTPQEVAQQFYTEDIEPTGMNKDKCQTLVYCCVHIADEKKLFNFHGDN